ncbi:MAG TPA: 50S ribosomal protein L1 [Candidatus Kapabacteria bacterium]|jgi:large subunit ribosomal protein L1|nr:50S ribosomal protein L1 [Candidatus Kapabacteria bacterium]HOV92485.1 50S ribosomal protein L1 [Candidatus Kapabacteria bacterium]
MKKKSKRFRELIKKVDPKKSYELNEAISLVKNTATAKFDESFEVAIKLGVDPRKADQMVRGTVSLPNGTGKSVRVLVLAKTPKDQEAINAGADYAGLDEYIEKIKGGWTDVDVIIATPDVMGEVGKLGRILGPRGLMPNPKVGTVTFDIDKAVREVKAGKIEYRVDKTGNVHAAIGKCSFEEDKIQENLVTFFNNILKAKPSSAKGKYVKNVSVCATMGPSVQINESSIPVE